MQTSCLVSILFPTPIQTLMKRNPLSSKTLHVRISQRFTFYNTLLLLFFLYPLLVEAQIMNAYARVTNYNTVTRRITFTGLNQTYHSFQVGQRLIIMQMQDNVIGTNTGNNANFGNLGTGGILNAGLYEIATISAVTASTITISAPLTRTYNPAQGRSVQIISFRDLGPNYATTANITALPWSQTNGIGGVVAIHVSGTLTLAHNITADGQGFLGGNASSNEDEDCIDDNFRTSSNYHGQKGGGIYIPSSNTYGRGRGKILNGGGGGSPHNAGGGGGSNFTGGGTGGGGYGCDGSPAGGYGGIALSAHITGSRMFMGGGGGGGQQNNTSGRAGSAGGGIVIIAANRITTSCGTNVRISANGAAATQSNDDGAGGGGGGGSVLIDANAWTVPASCPLRIQANGGDGGNVSHPDAHGGGGGGGQGAIIYGGIIPGSNVTATSNNGIGGENYTGGPRAQNGQGSNNSGIIVSGTVLPVDLRFFDAIKKGEKVLVQWEAVGVENTTFHILHSIDGIQFTRVGMVPGRNNTNGIDQFSFTHQQPVEGRNFYRLEMEQRDGRLEHSAIVEVTSNSLLASTVVYPNPASNHFYIRLRGTTHKTWSVSIADMSGTTIYQQVNQSAGGLLNITLDRTPAPGIYTIRLTAGGETRFGKLFIR